MDKNKRSVEKTNAIDLQIRTLLAGSSSGGILAQEAAGQKSFVNSDTLPRELQGESREVLEAAGVKFLGIVENDPIFQYVELPEGWQKRPTDHSMWSDLLDEKGRRRAGIFYKAAFYDRSAHLDVVRRFSLQFDYDKLDEKTAQTFVTDCGVEIWRSDPVLFEGDDYPPRREAKEKAKAMAEEWLTSNYPDWQNSASYWD